MPKRAATSPSVVEDSEDERKRAENGAKDGSDAEDGTGGDEEEYEIESIIDHKKGQVHAGRMSYYVKWKGYAATENSWVDEQDAEGAKDMIDEYWKSRKEHKDHPDNKKKRGRTSLSKTSSKTKVDSDNEDGSAKKRRASKVELPPLPPKKTKTVLESPMDTDDERPKKKTKTTKASEPIIESVSLDAEQLKAKLQSVATGDGNDYMTLDDPEAGSMKTFMHVKSWENLVTSIQTVEHAEDNSLRVYFVIKDGGEEKRVVEDSSICGKKFPQKLLQFYEAHLRWRSVDDAPTQE
ncbi:hypothetical protein AURDEDRAFT_114513 [Auricularia subglabra TFB-10046 SS5]|nr:hypothetical protein AURDEDRAFT_114513 [Auricularia subglabra TFB-10046 SS5]